MKRIVLWLICCSWLAGCGSAGTSTTTSPAVGTVDTALAGNWRILTENAYFDNGLTSTITPVSTPVVLDASGSWSFGSSSGTWTVADIEAADWTTWNIPDYGATRKLVLSGWNDGTSQGPIDEEGTTINNLWIVYSTVSETNGTGTIWMKLGAQ